MVTFDDHWALFGKYWEERLESIRNDWNTVTEGKKLDHNEFIYLYLDSSCKRFEEAIEHVKREDEQILKE